MKKAIILVAGMGSRLKPLTNTTHKCLTEVNGVPILNNALRILQHNGITETVLVIGYLGAQIKDKIGNMYKDMSISYVSNARFDATNTSYSLMCGLAKVGDYDELFILEGDVFFDDSVFEELVNCSYPNTTIVNRYNSYLDGSFVQLDNENYVIDWIHKSMRKPGFTIEDKYKTVNLHKFSTSFVQCLLIPELENSVKFQNGTEPIENILMRIVRNNAREVIGIDVSTKKWVEIDEVSDLRYAESVF